MEAKIVPLGFETYLSVVRNSVGSQAFRHLYASVDGVKQDVANDGDLSCAFFVSGVLKMLDLVKRVHGTVSGTVRDLENIGWQKIAEPRDGAVIVWEAKVDDKGEKHAHIGFYIGNNEAVSNSSTERTPKVHAWDYRPVEAVYWLEGLEKK